MHQQLQRHESPSTPRTALQAPIEKFYTIIKIIGDILREDPVVVILLITCNLQRFSHHPRIIIHLTEYRNQNILIDTYFAHWAILYSQIHVPARPDRHAQELQIQEMIATHRTKRNLIVTSHFSHCEKIIWPFENMHIIISSSSSDVGIECLSCSDLGLQLIKAIRPP